MTETSGDEPSPSAAADESASTLPPPEASVPLAKRFRRPGPLAAVVVGALVAVSIGVALFGRSSSSSSCLADAAAHIPSIDGEFGIEGMLWGGDMERARAAGFDDSGSFDDLGESHIETGVLPGPQYYRALSRLEGRAAPPAVAGYESAEVTCWIGQMTENYSAAVGDFDEGDVSGSELRQEGEVATDGELLTYSGDGDAATRLDEPVAVDDALAAALDELDSRDTVNFALVPGEDDPFSPPVAVALRHRDEWELLVIWLFPDEDTAEAGREAVAALLADGTGLDDVLDGDLAESLDQDGSTLVLEGPLDRPGQWTSPVVRLDAILYPGRLED